MPTTQCHSGLDPESSPQITIVCGSTATGKSAYAFNLAKKYKEVTIISVDSRQFYKDLPIISGADNMQDIPSNVHFFGQGILNPNETSNIGDFKKYADPIIANALKNKHQVILVGGSGLYLKALSENLLNTVIAPNLEFRAKAEKMSVLDLQKTLKNLNLSLFNSLNNSDVNNPRRLIRHIEINRHCEATTLEAEAISQSVIPGLTRNPATIQYQWIGLKKSPKKLLASINKRVISRMENGAVDEVKFLLKNYPDTSLPIYSTLGVKEIIKFLNKEITKEELIKNWTIADNNYAKRQTVWFKKQSDIVWYDSNI